MDIKDVSVDVLIKTKLDAVKPIFWVMSRSVEILIRNWSSSEGYYLYAIGYPEERYCVRCGKRNDSTKTLLGLPLVISEQFGSNDITLIEQCKEE